MTDTKLQEARWLQRREAVKALAEDYDIEARPDSTAGEDLIGYLNTDPPYEFARYCVVTRSDDHYYLYPDCNDLRSAKWKALYNIDDDIYPESPVKIVNLDTGEEWRPQFDKIVWKKEA